MLKSILAGTGFWVIVGAIIYGLYLINSQITWPKIEWPEGAIKLADGIMAVVVLLIALMGAAAVLYYFVGCLGAAILEIEIQTCQLSV